MKQQKQAKSLTPTQIKLVLERMIEMYNKEVVVKGKADAVFNDRLIKQYYDMLHDELQVVFSKGYAQHIIKVLKDARMHSSDGPANLKAVTGGDLRDGASVYKRSNWNHEAHPLHKVIKDMEFKLHMATADNYETYMKEFETQIKRILK